MEKLTTAAAPFQLDLVQSVLAAIIAGVAFFFLVGMVGGLEKAWEAIDISDNITKFRSGLREIDDGPSAWMHAIAYGAISLILLYFVWHFDISSSLDFSASLRDQMKETTGVLSLGAFGLAGITFLPSLLEMFGAKYAKLNVLWVQLAVIGLSAFDLFTDLPRIREFVEPYWPAFVNNHNNWLMNVAFGGLYYVVFGIMWVLGSYGCECMFICFVFATLGCVVKGITGGQAGRRFIGA